MVNVNMLKGKIVENGFTISKFAKAIGMKETTLYRRLKTNGIYITIGEADKIVRALNLSVDEANAIFFSQHVA